MKSQTQKEETTRCDSLVISLPERKLFPSLEIRDLEFV